MKPPSTTMDRKYLTRPWYLILAASWFAASAPVFAATSACTIPAEIKARLNTESPPQMHADEGNWFAANKRFDCAAQSYRLASRLMPSSATYKYLLGLSLLSAGRNLQALEALKAASAQDTGDIGPHLAAASALDQLKRTDEAEAEWRAALAIDADSDAALDGLSQDLVNSKDYGSVVRLLDKPSNARQRSSLQSLNLGIAFSGLMQLDDAIRVLREGMNTDPDSLPIADELALVLMLQGRVDEAYAVFDLALRKHPDDQTTRILYLRTLVSSHSDKASQLARELLASDPNQWEVLYLNAQLASAEGDFQRALQLCSKSVELNPAYPASQRLLGATLAKQGELEEAKQHLQKSIALGNSEPEVHYELARVLLGLKDPAQAQAQMQLFQQMKNAQSDKTQAAGKAEVADEAMKEGDAQKAAALYREALASDPNEPLLYYKLAKALEKSNDVAGEEASLQRAIELNPGLPEAQNQLGYLAVRRGNSAEAEKRFRAAVQASPSYVVAWVNLAAALADESRWKDADEALDHALQIDPDNVQARKLKELLAAAKTANQ